MMMRRRAKRRVRHMVMVLMMIIVAICMVCFLSGFKQTPVQSKQPENLTYTAYIVKSGDTLWQIADLHREDLYYSNDDYIDEVMRVNGMRTAKLREGQLIMVPCKVQTDDMTMLAGEE